jgi:hypothetical protein
MKCFSSPPLQYLLERSIPKLIGLGSAWILGAGIATLLPTTPAMAAERLVFTFGPIGRSIAIEDLRTLAETGEATSDLRWYLNFANLSPEDFQRALNRQISLRQQLVDRIGHTIPGEFVLHQIGETIHTGSRQANIQAIRGSLLLSTREDDKISLLEFLENYPTPELYIDGVSLLRFSRDVNRLKEKIEPIVMTVETFLEGLICNCENPTAPPSQP